MWLLLQAVQDVIGAGGLLGKMVVLDVKVMRLPTASGQSSWSNQHVTTPARQTSDGPLRAPWSMARGPSTSMAQAGCREAVVGADLGGWPLRVRARVEQCSGGAVGCVGCFGWRSGDMVCGLG